MLHRINARKSNVMHHGDGELLCTTSSAYRLALAKDGWCRHRRNVWISTHCIVRCKGLVSENLMPLVAILSGCGCSIGCHGCRRRRMENGKVCAVVRAVRADVLAGCRSQQPKARCCYDGWTHSYNRSPTYRRFFFKTRFWHLSVVCHS